VSYLKKLLGLSNRAYKAFPANSLIKAIPHTKVSELKISSMQDELEY
jgi:hypothetical protein